MAERVSIIDTSLLNLETEHTMLHTGGVSVFEPGLTFPDVYEALQSRLPDLPRARQRLQHAAFGAGRPVWVDDHHFDLAYHLRHAALPAPGTRAQLADFLARLLSRPLDRARPLWEMYVIEGLEGGRTAVFRKVHLVLGGEEREDPFAALLEATADPSPPKPPPVAPWMPEEPPSPLALAAEAVQERVVQLANVGRGARQVVATPRRLAGAALSAASSTAGVAWRLLGHAPASPLNRPLSPHRRCAMSSAPLDDLRAVRAAFGGTINDVVLTVIGDAVGRLLRWRGYDTKDLDLRVMVPVRVHEQAPGPVDEEADLSGRLTTGDGVVGVLAPLPVMELDPVARLYRMMGEMAGLKESRQAVAADILVRVAGYAPANLHAVAGRLVSGEQRYNLAVSNAPGPQTPRYLRGVRLEESYPLLPLSGDCALSIGVTSYNGHIFVGFTGDWDTMPDLDELAVFFDDALVELRDTAFEQHAPAPRPTARS